MKTSLPAILALLCVGLGACSDEPAEKGGEANPTAQAEELAAQRLSPPSPFEAPADPPTAAASAADTDTQADLQQDAAKPPEASRLPESVDAPKEAAFADEKPEALPPLTAEERRVAARALDFANQARELFQKGVHAAADELKRGAELYREEWRLPKRPKLPARHSRDSRLQAPKGIFSMAEEAELAKALDEMDGALNEILSIYRRLEKYVADSSIRDDGELGLELSGKILESHKSLHEARARWLALVEPKAIEAEAKLLREDPLRRQILAAASLFAEMRETASLVAAGAPRQALADARKSMAAIIDSAGKPPFQASPSLERLYRNFLKVARQYCQILDKGILEGFHNVQRRELAEGAAKCQAAYNEFVKAANQSR